jgi:HK97 family phage prohead protease
MFPSEVTARCEPPTEMVRGDKMAEVRKRHVELRLDGDEANPELLGYALVYDEPYRVGGERGFTETIAAGAASKAARESDVRLLVNHEGIPLARTRSKTLELRSDDAGLYVRSVLDGRSPLVQSVVSAMERGDLDEMSHAFQVVGDRQTWSDDYSQRTIHELRLFDVSVVAFPANPATVAKLRDDAPAEPTSPRMTVEFVRAFMASR